MYTAKTSVFDSYMKFFGESLIDYADDPEDKPHTVNIFMEETDGNRYVTFMSILVSMEKKIQALEAENKSLKDKINNGMVISDKDHAYLLLKNKSSEDDD